jgi:hypothetical protein
MAGVVGGFCADKLAGLRPVCRVWSASVSPHVCVCHSCVCVWRGWRGLPKRYAKCAVHVLTVHSFCTWLDSLPPPSPGVLSLQAHPADVVVDRCTLCGRGEEGGATDWIACDSCNSWVHFSCDKRPGLGTFDDYANADQPRSYTCPNCARSAVRLAQKGAGGQEAAAPAPAPAQQREPQPMET